MTDIRQAKPYASFLHALGWKTQLHPHGGALAAVKPLLPLFGILKLQRVKLEAINFDWLKKLNRKHAIFASYLELADRLIVPARAPYDARKVQAFSKQFSLSLKKHGYSPISHGMLPSKTQVIDLTLPPESIMAQMKPKTRYNINLAHKKKVQLKVISAESFLTNSSLLEAVISLLHKNARRAGYWVEGKSWIQKKVAAFAKQAFIIIAHAPESEQELLAVAIFLHSDDTLFYWVNGSTNAGRKVFAPTLIVYEALKIGQEKGLKTFDFDGVYDERYPNKRWLGYTRFKAGFGGHYVFYPPCFIKRFAYFR
jgi:lipid II:glycine glycyltransferase (peptidoglycan interpeptide bridge formation enzyme)